MNRRRLAEVSSTNEVLKRLAADGAPSGSVVVADVQTAGRGRPGHGWHSPPGGLYASFLIRASIEPRRWPRFTLAGALAAARALEETTGIAPTLRWPNDLFYFGRKVGGVLAEVRGPAPGGTGAVVVLGVGINLKGTRESFPRELRARAISLEMVPGARRVGRDELLGAVEAHWRSLSELVDRPAWEACSLELERRCPEAVGTMVRVRREPEGFVGRTAGLADDGALRVAGADGTLIEVRTTGSVRPIEEMADAPGG